MPIVIATCPDCHHTIEIDTARAVVLTGTAETIWRVVRQNTRIGYTVDVQHIAAQAFVHPVTVRRVLNKLTLMGLIERPLKRPGGVYRHYVLPRTLQFIHRVA